MLPSLRSAAAACSSSPVSSSSGTAIARSISASGHEPLVAGLAGDLQRLVCQRAPAPLRVTLGHVEGGQDEQGVRHQCRLGRLSGEGKRLDGLGPRFCE